MYNGLITSLSLYPIKHLNDFFKPYGSSLVTNILLTPMSSTLITFFCKNHVFYFFFATKIHVPSTHFYTG